MSVITVERKILQKNDEVAAENRARFKENRLFTLNLVSSPGSGKTTLLERILEILAGQVRISVVEGDVQTDNDAQRIAKYNVPVVQIITNGACHLEAKLVQDAVASLPLEHTDILVIENVGNLVCPASYDLGEDLKVVLFSTAEGDDKPLKYPKMFRVADVCIINKIDLLPYIEFDMAKARENALNINPGLTIFEVSAKTGEGIDEWIEWLRKEAQRRR
ncbi:MAG: hydrogenase nickel incorporation protein HypB [Calditrichaceae bacterium]|nr:hydrogenase nickel incorporation protein HypB [Calditrichia bacterium]NUQ39871.1 hydrogenase nickel incorporation protein HypB [Calditrichaceae bacterium]